MRVWQADRAIAGRDSKLRQPRVRPVAFVRARPRFCLHGARPRCLVGPITAEMERGRLPYDRPESESTASGSTWVRIQRRVRRDNGDRSKCVPPLYTTNPSGLVAATRFQAASSVNWRGPAFRAARNARRPDRWPAPSGQGTASHPGWRRSSCRAAPDVACLGKKDFMAFLSLAFGDGSSKLHPTL